MKAKTFDKKLILNKQTISSLNKTGMDSVKGGYVPPTWGIGSCNDTECWTIWPIYC